MLKSIIIISILIICLFVVAAAEQTKLIIKQTTQDYHQDYHNEPVVRPMDIQEDMIAYDNAPAVYWPNLTDVGTIFSVRFTPLQPCSLLCIHASSYSAPGAARIHVFDDNDGMPGEDLIAPFTVELDASIQFQIIDLSAPIEIGLDDFHIAVEYIIQPGIGPYVTGDNDNVTEARSQYKAPGDQNWTVVLADLNFRAWVNYFGNDQTPPSFIHNQQIFGFIQDDNHVLSAEITDANGISYADIHYSIDGSNWETIAMTNTIGDTWEGAIPVQETGAAIAYYLSAIDNSYYINEGFEPSAGVNNPYLMDIIDGVEIHYDDGTAEAWQIVDTSFNNNALAVRMTPSTYPAQILMARALVSDDTPFAFSINDFVASIPGDVIPGGENVITAGQEHGWGIAEWENGPIITSGSFYVVFHWNQNTPCEPAVGQDTDNISYNSYWYHGENWNLDDSGEWIIRCIVQTYTGIEELSGNIAAPVEYELIGNYPNPFNPSTEIKFMAPTSGKVAIDIFNITGQLVKTVFDGYINAGIHTVNWNSTDNSGNSVSSGVYYYRLTSDDKVDTKKMVLLK